MIDAKIEETQKLARFDWGTVQNIDDMSTTFVRNLGSIKEVCLRFCSIVSSFQIVKNIFICVF